MNFTYKSSIRLLIISLSTLALVVTSSIIFAQESLRIIHKQLNQEDMPSPGELFSLTVSLQGTREVHPHIKLIMLMDGKLLEYPLGTGKLNSNNEPEFQLMVPAPEFELSYQFIIPTSSDGVLSSPQFSYKRQCAEKKILTEFPIKESDQGVLFRALSQTATNLEYEVKLYRVADDLLQKIKKSASNVPSDDE